MDHPFGFALILFLAIFYVAIYFIKAIFFIIKNIYLINKSILKFITKKERIKNGKINK